MKMEKEKRVNAKTQRKAQRKGAKTQGRKELMGLAT
jgi:hypothetical protein